MQPPVVQQALAPQSQPDVDPLTAAMAEQEAKAEQKAAKSLFEKAPVFHYGSAKEEITDPGMTFEELRIAKADDFPELGEGKRVSWTVEYGKTTKAIADPKGTTIASVKTEIERSKPFLDALKKAKDKNPDCLVKPRVTAQSKGIASYKGVFTSLEEAQESDKAICLFSGGDGKVYELRKTELGEFIAPKDNVTDLGLVRAGFAPALPLVPILLSVAFMGLVYRGLSKIMPDALSTIFTPFITVLVSVPVSLIALAPLGTNIGNAIGEGIATFGGATGFFGVAVLGAIWQFLVMTGMHVAVLMPFLMDFMEKGYQTGAILGPMAAQWACWAVGLGAFLRLKNKQEKSQALGFFVSGFLGGVTEPTMYGLCMKYKKCWLGIIAGGFVGGAYLGISHACQYVLVTASNFLALIGYTGGSTMNLVNGIIGCVLGLVTSVVVVYFFGFSKDEIKE